MFKETVNPFRMARYDGDDDGGQNRRGRGSSRGEEKLAGGELGRLLALVSLLMRTVWLR